MPELECAGTPARSTTPSAGEIVTLLTASQVTRRPAGGHYGWGPSCGGARPTSGGRPSVTDGPGGRGYGGGMDPQTALDAVAWRRLLVSLWPWRSALYLLATLPSAAVAAALLAVPTVPWLVLAHGGRFENGAIVLLILLGCVRRPDLRIYLSLTR
jgi:hypothetical protein